MQLSIRRPLAVLFAALTLSPLAGSTPSAEAATTYHTVGVGDSILDRLTRSGLLQSSDRWWDTEPGRQVDLPGNAGRSSFAAIWPSVIARSQPGGFVVFEDDGTRVTDARWAEFMQYIVDSTPDDRCLVGVLTYFDPVAHPGNHRVVKARRNVMRRIFAQQPCHSFVNLDQYFMFHPEGLADGQHPNEIGQRFVASRIDAIVGPRR